MCFGKRGRRESLPQPRLGKRNGCLLQDKGFLTVQGDRTYDFDHKDNNPANNSQRNCRLVCKVCHGKHTVVKKRKIKGFLGETIGHKTIKKKVGYKKPKKKPKKTKRIAIRDVFGNVIGYRTVKVRLAKATGKKTTSRQRTTKRPRKSWM